MKILGLLLLLSLVLILIYCICYLPYWIFVIRSWWLLNVYVNYKVWKFVIKKKIEEMKRGK